MSSFGSSFNFSNSPFDSSSLVQQGNKYVPKTREELQTINKQQMTTFDERRKYQKQIEDLKFQYDLLKSSYNLLYREYEQIYDVNEHVNEMMESFKPSYESLADFASEHFHEYYNWLKQKQSKN